MHVGRDYPEGVGIQRIAVESGYGMQSANRTHGTRRVVKSCNQSIVSCVHTVGSCSCSAQVAKVQVDASQRLLPQIASRQSGPAGISGWPQFGSGATCAANSVTATITGLNLCRQIYRQLPFAAKSTMRSMPLQKSNQRSFGR
jgi:hypothetical protein